MVDSIRFVLSKESNYLVNLGHNGMNVAREKLTVDSVYGEFFAEILRFLNDLDNRIHDMRF